MIAFLVLVGTVLTWHAIDKGEKFHAYSIWWMITMIGAASYAREKMPQVGIHIAVPMILLLGVYGQKLATVGAFRRWRPVAFGVLALALAWQAKASVHMCFRNPGDVRERLVYGDTTPDLKAHVELVRRYQAVASVRHGLAPVRVPNRNPAYNPPEWMEWYNDKTRLKAVKVLAKQPDAIWPLRWYLRDVEWTEWLDVNRAIDEKYPFMFLSVGDETRFPRLEQEYHLYRGRVRMHWTPPDINWGHLVSIWKNAIPAHYLDNTAQASGAYDSKQEWLKLWRYWWRREVYEGQGAAYTSLSTVEYLFAARKDLGPY
jgi:hypothetical protein